MYINVTIFFDTDYFSFIVCEKKIPKIPLSITASSQVKFYNFIKFQKNCDIYDNNYKEKKKSMKSSNWINELTNSWMN